MRTYSILLTIALLIPIIGNMLFAFEFYYLNSHREFGHVDNVFILRSYATPLVGDFVFIAVALVLNFKRKYYENCIMCITIVSTYIMFLILNYGINFLFNWLR